MTAPAPRVLALSGGVGGARLARGLADVLPPGGLAVAVNVADDFVHLGLSVSPDLDTVMYTLAGVVNPQTGWGRDDGELVLHGRAGTARRRDLVPPRRPRPRRACRAHPPPRRRRTA